MGVSTASIAVPQAISYDRRTLRRIVLASLAGNALEWYDFFLYGTAAALVFGQLFFPKGTDPLVGTLGAFAGFAVGFVARPFGGVLFGHIGDRAGRKTALVLTLTIMGAATFSSGRFRPTSRLVSGPRACSLLCAFCKVSRPGANGAVAC